MSPPDGSGCGEEPPVNTAAREAKLAAEMAASKPALLPEGIASYEQVDDPAADEAADDVLPVDDNENFLTGIAANIAAGLADIAAAQLKQLHADERLAVAAYLADRHGFTEAQATAAIEKLSERKSEGAKPANGNDQGAHARLGMLMFKDINDSAVTDKLVKGLKGEESFTVMAGPSGSAKTFLALHVSICVAMQMDFFGRKTMRCGVLYVGAEGQAGLKKRIKAWKLHHAIDGTDVPFALYPAPIDLVTDPSGADAIAERVEMLKGLWPEVTTWLVVIDTLARCFGSGDESATRDMNTFVTRCDTIRHRCKAAVMVVHHFGKDESKGMRGSVALKAAADTVIEVTGLTGTRTAKVEKQKDGQTGEQFTFTLKPVEIGTDDDGEAVTSCIVEPAEPEAAPVTGGRLTPNQQTMLSILADAGKGGLTVEEWNERGKAAGIGTKRRTDLYDCRIALKRQQLVYEWEGKWLRQ